MSCCGREGREPGREPPTGQSRCLAAKDRCKTCSQCPANTRRPSLCEREPVKGAPSCLATRDSRPCSGNKPSPSPASRTGSNGLLSRSGHARIRALDPVQGAGLGRWVHRARQSGHKHAARPACCHATNYAARAAAGGDTFAAPGAQGAEGTRLRAGIRTGWCRPAFAQAKPPRTTT